jgi:hypothetical protein
MTHEPRDKTISGTNSGLTPAARLERPTAEYVYSIRVAT